MEFGVWTKGLATVGVDCLVLGVFEEAELSGEARSVDAACAGRLKALLERGDFAGRAGDTLLVGELPGIKASRVRSEEHTSELQSLRHLVCRLLLEKKKDKEMAKFVAISILYKHRRLIHTVQLYTF